MGQQLQIRDGKMGKLVRDGAREVLVRFVVETTQTWSRAFPSVGRSVKGNMDIRLLDKEGVPVAFLDGDSPPPNVLEEVVSEDGWLLEGSGESFRGQASIEEEAADEDNVCDKQQLAAEDGQLVFRSSLFGRPGEEDG